jgi:hypothetical protein
MRKQKQITPIRYEPFYKQLEVNILFCGNRKGMELRSIYTVLTWIYLYNCYLWGINSHPSFLIFRNSAVWFGYRARYNIEGVDYPMLTLCRSYVLFNFIYVHFLCQLCDFNSGHIYSQNLAYWPKCMWYIDTNSRSHHFILGFINNLLKMVLNYCVQ